MRAVNFRTKYFGLALVGVIALVAAGCGFFSGALNKSTDAVNKTNDGAALKGYDAVAYFNEGGAPTLGKPEFAADWNGAKWQFASAVNRDAFQKEPEKYAPQYGGYCAWAVGHGYTADTDPQTGKVVDGKLYLNYNREVAKEWQKDIPKYVADGDKNWKNLAGNAEAARKDK